MRILLVEDDEILGEGIQRALARESYQIEWVKDGVHALQALQTDAFVLAILDLGLPRMDGLDVLSTIRKQNNATPVLVLTARDTLDDKVKGLDQGADDYLIKPFELDELLARVRALGRRQFGQSSTTISLGGLNIDPRAFSVSLDGEAITLSRREFALLMEFVNCHGRVLTRQQLEDIMYGWDGEIESNAIEVHIHHLRKKLYPQLIKTIRGVGYKLNID